MAGGMTPGRGVPIGQRPVVPPGGTIPPEPPAPLERVDDVWREHRAWGGVADLIPEPPSTYYYRQVYGCFFRDQHGLNSLDVIGVDNVTFETDYPHTDTTWPNTKAVAEKMMADLSDEVKYKVLRGNAIRMLSLDIT